MANTIRIKRRASGNAGAPGSLQNAELAFNEVDDVLYYGEGTGGAGGTATTVMAIGGPGAFTTLSTEQTISGNKTFSGIVIVPTPTSSNHAANKGYVDTAISGVATSFTVAGNSGTNQTITSGTDTLSILGGTGISTVASATDIITINIDSTVTTLTGSQTLTNKTLTNPVINAGSGTLVLPQGTAPAQTAEGSIFWDTDDDLLTVGTLTARKTMVDTDSTQTLTNKSLSDSTTFLIDDLDSTKRMQFQLSGITTATTRTLTVPNVNGTIITTGDTGTVTNTMLAGSIALTKLSSDTTTALGVGSLELGNASDTTISRVSAGRIAVEGVNVVTTSSSDTLSNKSIALGSNTLTGTKAEFNTAVTDDDFAYIGTANTFTANQTITGTVTTRAAATQDSVILQGRAGGTTSLGVTITPTTLTASRTLTLPDTTGTIITTGDTGTVTSAMILDGTIVNADISGSAAIAHSKLANATSGQVLLGTTTTGAITATTLTGDVTIDGAGVTSIASGVIVNADISSSAAIALSKLASGTSAQVIVANASGVPTYTTISGDITISNAGVATIQPDSVALGTDTTGNYVASLVAGTGVTLSNNTGESATPTIAIGQAVATTDSPTFNNVTLTGDIAVNGGDVTTTSLSATLFSANATAITIGSSSSTVTVGNNLAVSGNLTVNGNLTTINSSTISVDDKNLELGSVVSITGLQATLSTGTAVVTLTGGGTTSGLIVGQALTKTSGTGAFGATPTIASIDSSTQFTVSVNHATAGAITFDAGGSTDSTANGGGLTLKGATDKTIVWDSANTNWTSSEHWNLATGKVYKINNNQVLSSTAVLGLTPTINSTGYTLSGGTTAVAVTFAGGAAYTISGTNGQTYTLPASGGALAVNPMTTLGDTSYGGASGVPTRLAGTTSTTKQFLTQTGTGSASQAPAWGTIANADIPTALSGKTIDSTSIGATTRSTGAFTTLAANNAVTFTVNTGSTSTSTGTLVVTGGVGISQNVWIGGSLNGSTGTNTLDGFTIDGGTF